MTVWKRTSPRVSAGFWVAAQSPRRCAQIPQLWSLLPSWLVWSPGPGTLSPALLGLAEIESLDMFTYDLVPLASEVGLQRATAVLDRFMPAGEVDRVTEERRWAVARVTFLTGHRTGGPGQVLDLMHQLRADGDPEAAELLSATWDWWREHRHEIDQALNAALARDQWSARRRVADSPEARRQLRSWSQQARTLVPQAVDIADRAAQAVNDAAQRVSQPPPLETHRKALSWH